MQKDNNKECTKIQGWPQYSTFSPFWYTKFTKMKHMTSYWPIFPWYFYFVPWGLPTTKHDSDISRNSTFINCLTPGLNRDWDLRSEPGWTYPNLCSYMFWESRKVKIKIFIQALLAPSSVHFFNFWTRSAWRLKFWQNDPPMSTSVC